MLIEYVLYLKNFNYKMVEKEVAKKRLHNPKSATKKGCILGGPSQKLTLVEQEVLDLLCVEFLTPKKVAIRRHCSKQAVSKVIIRLKKKGAFGLAYNRVDKSQPTCQPSIKSQPLGKDYTKLNSIRLHGQEFNIKILFKDLRYRGKLEKSNTIFVDGNTIRLYKNSIEVYSGQSFFADDTQKATVKSFEYWNRFFARLEHDLKVILVKPRSQNIKLVNQHYAEINNELAEECEKKSDKIRVYTTDDGKLWFTVDNSFNLHEAETLHPKSAKGDMQDVVRPFFNDLRDNKPPTLSELMGVLNEMALINKETASGLNVIVSFLKTQVPKPEEKFKPKNGGRGAYYFG